MDPLRTMPRLQVPPIPEQDTATSLPRAALLAATVTTLIGLALLAVERMRAVTARMERCPQLASLGGVLGSLSASRRDELWRIGVALSGRRDARGDGEGSGGPPQRVAGWLAALSAAETRGRALGDELDRRAGAAGPEERRLLIAARTELGVLAAIEAGIARALAPASLGPCRAPRP